MYQKTGIEQGISNVNTSNKTIMLMDGSKWEVSGIHGSRIVTWMSYHKVVIEKHGLNYKMTNTNKDVTVDVKHIN